MMAAAAVADVMHPLPVDLHALDGDTSEMPDSSVSLLQTRMEKMRKSQVSVEAADNMKVSNQAEGAVQASEAMQEMGEAITELFSLNTEQLDKPKGADAIKSRAALKSTAIGKASHAIEDVKQVFSKLLAQEEFKAKVGKDKMEKKHDKKSDDLSFAQSQEARIGHSSTFDMDAAADFWDDADVKAVANDRLSGKESSVSNVDIWDEDWKAASSAGSIDVTKIAKEGSYLSQSHFVQSALDGHHADTKSDVDGDMQQKVVLSWGADNAPSKNSLLSAKSEGVPLTMAKEKVEDDEAISSKKFETSDEQVVKAFIGGNVAQNSKSVQSILSDMKLSPDDQGIFGAAEEDMKAKGAQTQDKAVVQNQSSLAANNQSKSEVQNQTVLAAAEQDKSDAPNKTSLATVGSAIKSVIKSVENSSWPWSKHAKPEGTGAEEVLAKDASNNTVEINQTSANGKDNTTKEDAAKSSATKTELEKLNSTATKENAAAAVLESSNNTAQGESGTKSNKTSDAKVSANGTSNSTVKL